MKPASEYDQMVDWERRLGREAAFFRELFTRVGAHRIVDVGCGSGKHAIMFREWGHEVVCVDPSESMRAQAVENAADAGVDLEIMEGGFGGLAPLVGEGWDVVLTLGNGLPHVNGVEGLHVTLRDFASILRPGGVVVLHLLNHARLISQRIRMLPPAIRSTPEGDRVFLKVLDYAEGAIMFDFVTLTRDPGAVTSAQNAFASSESEEAGWHLSSRRSVHTALPVSVLSAALDSAGFEGIELYGNHAGKVLDPDVDESVIVVARRG